MAQQQQPLGRWAQFSLLAILLGIPPAAGCQGYDPEDRAPRDGRTDAERQSRAKRPSGPTGAEQAKESTGKPREEITESSDHVLALIERLKGSFQTDELGPGQPVIVVDLSFTAATDADLSRLGGLTGVHELYLIDTKITNAGLEHLHGYSSLHTLDLARSRVTDDGLLRLAGLSNLRTLGLSGTQITDAGIVSLRALTGLQTVDVSNTEVTEAGIQVLRSALPKTRILR